MCRSKVCFIWEVVTRILLGWFSNWTATSVYDCARKSNNWLDLGLTNIGHRKSISVPSARSPVAKWRSRSVAKSAYCLFWSARFALFGVSFHFPRGQTENPVHRSFFPPKPNGNACYARYQNLRSRTWIGCIRKRSYTEFGMPMLQKETPGSVNVCWMESVPMAPFLSSENNLLFTREWTHFHICDCALGFSLVLKERCKSSQNWAIWK